MKSDLDKLIDKHFPVIEVEWTVPEVDWKMPEIDWNIPEVKWTELDKLDTKKKESKSNKSDTIKKAANQHNSTP